MSIICAIAEGGRVIGFTVALIDRQRFNRRWILRSLLWLGPLVMVKFFLSSNVRRLVLTQLQAKIRYLGKEGLVARKTDMTRLKKPGQAMSCRLAVDETFRGQGIDVASRLIISLEQQLKERGVNQVHGFTARKNLATIFVYLKNGWQIIPDDNGYLIVKDL